MSRSSLPIAGDQLRRASMKRTIEHMNNIRAGRVPYIRSAAAAGTWTVMSRNDAIAFEEKILDKIRSLRG